MAPARDRRIGFSRRRQYGLFLGYVLAVAGAIVGAVLLAVSSFQPSAFAALRMSVATLTAPVSAAAAATTRGVAAVPRAIGTYFAVHGENARLRAEVIQSRRILAQVRAVAYDNRRLKRLMAVRDRVAAPVVTARLVSSTATSTRRFALLDAGRAHGVRPGQPVRGPEGLVGRVVETGPFVARVLLLGDPDSMVPVRRTRDGMPAIAAGRGDGTVDLRSVDATNVVFERGDAFVTSGTGGIYAPGVPVARVVARARDTAVGRTFAQPSTFDWAVVESVFMPLPPPAPLRPTAP